MRVHAAQLLLIQKQLVLARTDSAGADSAGAGFGDPSGNYILYMDSKYQKVLGQHLAELAG